MHISNKTLWVMVGIVVCLTVGWLWGAMLNRVRLAEAKIVALEHYDEQTTETVAEVITQMHSLKKSRTGYQTIANRDFPYASAATDCWVGDTNTGRIMSCEEAWLIREDAEPPCLAQMEAAMRAMHVFIPHQLVVVTSAHDSWWEPYRRIDELEMPAYTAAMKQWNAVKQDCWRQP